MADLRLRKLPDRTPVKLSIHVSPGLNQALSEYAELYEQAYGARESVQDLIPAMLEHFIESDRTFARRRQERAP